MARLDRDIAAVIAGDVVMVGVLVAFVATLMAPPAQVPESTLRDGLRDGMRDGRQAEPVPWPEPAVGTYAR